MRFKLTRITYFSISLLFLLSQSACKRSGAKFDYIIFGVYYGECVGNCAQFYKLTESKLYRDCMDSYLYQSDIKFELNEMDPHDFEKAKSISTAMPDFFKKENSQTIGFPDCRDQGGFYLEIRANGETKIFKIDTSTREMTKEQCDYVALLKQTLSSLPE